MKLTVYGCRGSVPYARSECSRYGGNTSCMRIEAGGHQLIVDAGSGLMQLQAEWREIYPSYPGELPFPVDILLSHLHMDHIIGLTAFEPVLKPGVDVRLFTASTPMFGAYKPPYWPVSLDVISRARIVTVNAGVPFNPGGSLTVTPFAANHPDNAVAFHITDGEKVVVYLLDSETSTMTEAAYGALVSLCKNADAVIFDAAYDEADYPAKRGWGHSTVKDGVRLADACHCKRMIFSHFDQEYGDDRLDAMYQRISGLGGGKRFLFARDGMEVTI